VRLRHGEPHWRRPDRDYFWFWQGLQLQGSYAGFGAFSQGSQQSQAQPAVVVRTKAQAKASIVMRFMNGFSSCSANRWCVSGGHASGS
jgi:hypothetical protein